MSVRSLSPRFMTTMIKAAPQKKEKRKKKESLFCVWDKSWQNKSASRIISIAEQDRPHSCTCHTNSTLYHQRRQQSVDITYWEPRSQVLDHGHRGATAISLNRLLPQRWGYQKKKERKKLDVCRVKIPLCPCPLWSLVPASTSPKTKLLLKPLRFLVCGLPSCP